jgi:hypothetical protein
LAVGDVFNFWLLKCCLIDADTRKKPKNGEPVFRDNRVLRFYPNTEECEAYTWPNGIYVEARYGVVVARFDGDPPATVTFLPEFSNGGAGAWQDAE